jgi:hypothetical protein
METIKTTAGQTAKKLAAIVVACGFIFSSCAKDGATGPQGPAGTNGAANISVNNVYAMPGNWIADGNGGWYNIVTTTSFGTGIDLTKGSVSLFLSADNTTWTAMPFVGYMNGQGDVNYTFNSTTITIYYDAQTGVASIPQPTNNIYIKAVIIPPAMVKPNVNPHNYNELKAAYNLWK